MTTGIDLLTLYMDISLTETLMLNGIGLLSSRYTIGPNKLRTLFTKFIHA